MKKFKQICVIVFLALLLLIVGTCIVLFWVNPELLKNTFEYGKTILDHPLPIIGVSVGVFCFTLFQIFSHTSFGKRLYNKAEKDVNNTLAKCEEHEKKAEEYYKNAEELKNDTIAVLNDFSTKYEELSKYLITACETSPNAKLQALGKEIEQKTNEEIASLNEKVIEFGEYKPNPTIEELKKQIDYLTQKIEKVVDNNEEPKD